MRKNSAILYFRNKNRYLSRLSSFLNALIIGLGISLSMAHATEVVLDKNVVGIVTDEKGSPLPGVSIVVKNTKTGTTTNVEGKYALDRVADNAVLVFSFVGFVTQEVSIGSKTVHNIRLAASEDNLNEVVVIGYGTANKKDLTGSVGTVNVTDMNLAPVKSFDEALAGRVAGVQVTSNDGQPGSLPNIVIRGANSLTQDNSPLYVIDGFPIESNDNNALNPADIESIDILKDASATAIYGSRGANGVIMITTKSGKTGAPSINYNGSYGFLDDINRLEVLSPYEFVKLQLESNNPDIINRYLTFPEKTLEDYKSVEGIDWYEKVLQRAHMHNHSISVSGGSNTTKYSFSGSVLDQDGIFVNTGFRRYQGRFKLDQTINPKFKVGINVNYSDTKEYGTIATANGGSTSASLMYSIWSYRPFNTDQTLPFEESLTDPAINPLTDYRTNPLIQVQNEQREKFNTSINASAYAEYAITKDLKLRITGNINRGFYQDATFNNSLTRTGNPAYPQSLGVNGSEYFTKSNNFSNENTLTYRKKIGKFHNFSILGGYSQQATNSARFGAVGTQLPNEALGLSGIDEGTPQTIQSYSSQWALQSLFTRLHYDFKSKYLLDFTIRGDGSSKFAKGNRWGYFPSAAVAYKLVEEEFMKDLNFVTDAKVRLGYGVAGNNRVSDFAYLSSLNFASHNGYSFDNAVPDKGAVITALANPDLQWELTNTINAGIDLAFFNNRLTFTGDYYYKRTNDLLLNAQLPYATGYTQAFKNIGAVSNSGIELSFNSFNITRPDFKWNSSFNITFNKNKVLALTEGQEALTSTTWAIYNSNPVYIAKIGQPIAMMYGVIFDGVYQYEDFDRLASGAYALKPNIAGNGANRASIQPGDAKYRDLDNDGIINLNDYTTIGNPNPDFIGGLNNNFEYKGFDLNVFFQFSYGNDALNANRVAFENATSASSNTNQYATYLDRWSPENTSSNIPRYNGYGQNLYTSRLVEDASFLRLKTVSLGYNIASRILQPIKMKSARIYVSAQNLYTWTKYSGIDPEVSTRHSALTPGFDFSPYPRARTIVFGLNASF
ncbi:TonB-linked SusC/RagA family outer membrane protein [Dyadobacter jejuensis]|uniref:TonB-linked SusC/RagA family outer membrane protein n=1 Tax=Dyadobacter jejuensis TaxID=1082580 RepID=A0A316AJ58_9BACT|nr:TonB-dependent receptor [Dyadobacter jejuensis]PWJ56910.1 TonB-linked SusC/RagA family outer membrane protein [Dyadobacter jejuensis]